jgi:hypothetical protein
MEAERGYANHMHVVISDRTKIYGEVPESPGSGSLCTDRDAGRREEKKYIPSPRQLIMIEK